MREIRPRPGDLEPTARSGRDPLIETLARIGRDMAQQRMAAEHHKRLGLGDRHHYHEYHRHEQGRWAFYESARLICQYFGQDFEAWLNEWGPEVSAS